MLADGDGVGQAILRELLVVGALRCCHKFFKNGNFSLGLLFGNTSGNLSRVTESNEFSVMSVPKKVKFIVVMYALLTGFEHSHFDASHT